MSLKCNCIQNIVPFYNTMRHILTWRADKYIYKWVSICIIIVHYAVVRTHSIDLSEKVFRSINYSVIIKVGTECMKCKIKLPLKCGFIISLRMKNIKV